MLSTLLNILGMEPEPVDPCTSNATFITDKNRMDWLEIAKDVPIRVTTPIGRYVNKLGWWNIGRKYKGQHLFPTLRTAIDAMILRDKV